MNAPATMARPEPRVTNPVEAMRWASQYFVWVPELQRGYFPVTEQPYDSAYWAKYEGYAETVMGRAITAARVALVRRHAPPAVVCDVGIGCGDFLTQLYLAGMDDCGFDINPMAVAWLEKRHCFRDPREIPTAIVTFFDSIEHLPNPEEFVAAARSWVFCTLPIVPGDGPPRLDWKHFRKDEHVWYWTRSGLIRWMREQGFECVECNAAETLLGREDVQSFAFRRVCERSTTPALRATT